jgi:uracil-DNA glycosylase
MKRERFLPMTTQLSNDGEGETLERPEPRLHESWRARLVAEFDAPYMRALRSFLVGQIEQGKVIYPKPVEWFAALDSVPFEQVRVVILGQDPYHGEGQAHGLCFSVRPGVTPPPSLVNIFKELRADLGVTLSKSGSLLPWARQGVLLLNSVLTVEAGRPASHQGKGWEIFTDRIIERLAAEKEGLVFVLWGSYAQKKGAFIDRSRHYVIESVHPSPLSAHRGFMGSRPFSKINDWLKKNGSAPIDWTV